MTTSSADFRYSVSQFSTPHNNLREDLEQIRRTGATGIGMWEGKLNGEERQSAPRLLADFELLATFCVPAVWSFLPSGLSPEPAIPAARVDQMLKSLDWLAEISPVAVVVTPGSLGDLDPSAADKAIRRGLARVAQGAADAGLRVVFEPIRNAAVSTFASSIELLDDLALADVQVLVDVWHLWDEPGLRPLLGSMIDRVGGVQVNDWRNPTRGWTDRALPGEGSGALDDVLTTVIEAGFDGWYDLEVFSDDGTYVTEYPDSFWHGPHEDMLRQAYTGFSTTWQTARRRAGGGRR